MSNLKIRQLMIPENRYWLKSPYTLEPKGIIIHNTANLVSAIREASFSAGNNWEVSSHYYVDENEAIQSLPLNRNAWHASDGTDGFGNRNTICIEICRSTGDLDQFKKAELNAVKLTLMLMKEFNIPLSMVKRHYDYARDKKYCPHKTMDLGWQRWLNFVKDGKVEPEADLNILSKPSTTVAAMQAYARANNADKDFIDLADVFYDVSVKYGVDPVITYTQSGKETAFMKFGGVLDKSFKNPCGLKTTAGGDNYDKNAHKRFTSWEEGIQAQVEHLALYAGHKDSPFKNTVDPRHFPNIKGKAPTVKKLGGNWAPSLDYGNDIYKRVQALWEFGKVTYDDKVEDKKPFKQGNMNTLIAYDKDAKEFALELSKRLQAPTLDYEIIFNYYGIENVIGVGEDVNKGRFTSYLTHFINARDDWSTKRNQDFLNAAKDNINQFKL